MTRHFELMAEDTKWWAVSEQQFGYVTILVLARRTDYLINIGDYRLDGVGCCFLSSFSINK